MGTKSLFFLLLQEDSTDFMSAPSTQGSKRITRAPIHPIKVMDLVKDNKAGAMALFIGTVREHGQMGKIVGMSYESYFDMAEDKLRRIERSATKKYEILKVKAIHRVGELSIGEISVIVAVSAPHRSEAFRACRYAIERIKKEVPIWKKEKMDGGIEVWVRN